MVEGINVRVCMEMRIRKVVERESYYEKGGRNETKLKKRE